MWKTSGTGTFDDPSVLHPAYTPGTEDIQNGLVTLSLIATAAEPCQADTGNITLTIATQASVSAGEDKTICEGEQYVLNDASAMNYSSLAWSTSGTGTFTDPYAIHPAYIPGEEDVLNGMVLLTLTVTSVPPCLPISDTMELLISEAPFVKAGNEGSTCQDIPYQVTGASAQNYSTLIWSHNGSGILTGMSTLNPTYFPAPGETGNIILTLKAYGNGACKDTFAASQMTILIYERPLANAGDDQTIESGTSASLTGSGEGGSGNYSFIWEPSGLLPDNTAENSVTVALTKDTTFTLTVTDLVSGCTGTDSVRISLSSKPNPPEEECIVIHNVITPNGDGTNDTWIIDCIENFPVNEVLIFDRWGDKINEFSNYDNHLQVWKGTNLRDEAVPDGTYYYVLTIRDGGKYAGWVFVRGGTK